MNLPSLPVTLRRDAVENYRKWLLDQGLTQKTVENYVSDFRRWLVWLNDRPGLLASDLTPAAEKFLEDLAIGHPQSTVNRRTAALRRFADFLAQGENQGWNLSQQLFGGSAKRPSAWTEWTDRFSVALAQEGCNDTQLQNYVGDVSLFLSKFPQQDLEQTLNKYEVARHLREMRQKGAATLNLSETRKSLHKFAAWATDSGYFLQNPLGTWWSNLVHSSQFGSALPQRLNSDRLSKLPNWRRWYLAYHRLPFTNALHLAVLVVFASMLTVFAFRQFGSQVASPFAYPSAPVRPNRQLNFQGRLTDSVGTPITTGTNVVFRLYDADTAGTELWDSGTCSIDPDQDGIFSTALGDTCGTEIPENVFSELANVWLEIEVGGEILEPRQQISSVPFALNTETVQGFPVSLNGDINTIPVINALGQLIIGASNPSIIASSGAFLIQGESLTFATEAGGDITLQPGVGGTIEAIADTNVTGDLSATGQLVLSSYTTNGGILYTDAVGVVAQTAVGALGECLISAGGGAPDWGSCSDAVADSIPWQVTNGTANLKNTTLDLLVGGNSTTSAKFAVLNVNGSGPATATVSGNLIVMPHTGLGGQLGIGTTSPTTPLQVVGTASFWHTTPAVNAGGIAIRNYNGSVGNYAVMEIAGTNNAVWTSGQGIRFNNHGASVEVGAPFTALTELAGNRVWLGTASPLGTDDSVIVTAGSGRADIMAMRYASTPYPDLYVSAPSISFNTKNSTGWADGAAFAGYGTTRMIINGDGNVGIGTATPTSKLHVEGFYGGNALARFNATGGGDILTASSSGTTRFTVTSGGQVQATAGSLGTPGYSFVGDTDTGIYRSADNILRIVGGGTEFLSLNSSYVGSSIRFLIQDGTNASPGLAFWNDAGQNTGLYQPNDDELSITAGGTEILRATSTGLSSVGTLTLSAFSSNGGLLYTNGSGVVAQTAVGANGECLVSAGGGAPGWSSCSAAVAGSIPWQVTNGTANLKNTTLDLLVGGDSTTSADFAVLNVNGTGPATASVSGNLIVMPKVGAAGRLGIGTTNPSTNLHIAGQNAGLRINGYTGSSDIGELRIGGGNTQGRIRFWWEETNEETAQIEAIRYNGATAGALQFNLQTFDTMMTTPSFQLAGSTGVVGHAAANFGSSNGVADTTVNIYNSGTGGGQEVLSLKLANNQTIANSNPGIALASINTIGTEYNFAKIVGLKTQSWGSGATPYGGLGFYTTNGSTTFIEAARIDANGNFGIGGDTTPDSIFSVGSTSQFQVNSSGAIAAATGITSSGTITFSGLTDGLVRSTSGVLSGAGTVSLTTEVTGVLPVANGGTNASSVGSAGSVAYSTGSAYAFSAVGALGECLISGNTGAPTWSSCSTAVADSIPWQVTNGTANLKNTTLDLLVGGNATTSAKFAVLNVNGSGPVTASISGNLIVYPKTGLGGNVGIGTVSPTARLHIAGGNLRINDPDDSANSSYNQFQSYAGDARMGLLSSSSIGSGYVFRTNGYVIGFGPGSQFTGYSVGGGIGFRGTSSPVLGGAFIGPDTDQGGTHKSLVLGTPEIHPGTGYGTTDIVDIGTISISGNTYSGTRPSIRYTALDHQFRVNSGTGSSNPGTDAMIISSTGNVGIGTTSPDYQLEVEGGSAGISINRTGGEGFLLFQTGGSGGAQVRGLTGGGLRFTNAGASTEWAQFDSTGNFGIGDASPTSLFTVGSGDLFQVNSSGAIAAATGITSSGTVTLSAFTANGGLLYTNGSGVVAQTAVGANGECLVSAGGGAPGWSSCSAAVSSSIAWEVQNGAANLKNSTLDLLVGGSSSASAKFAVLNVNNGTPTASISAGTTGGLYFTASGSAQTTARQDFNIGGGTTGNIVFNNRNNTPFVTLDTVNNRVGVGTATPARMLDVLDASNAQLRLSQSGSIYGEIQTDASGYLRLTSTGSRIYLADTSMYVENSGGNRNFVAQNFTLNSLNTTLNINSGTGVTNISGTTNLLGNSSLGGAAGQGVLAFTKASSTDVQIKANLQVGHLKQNLRIFGADTSTGFAYGITAGDVFIAGGDDSWGVGDGNVILAHTGSTAQGSVGIGTTSPSSLLSVGSSSQFQVNSSGAIAAATGITSSGTITFSGLSDGLVRSTSGVLSGAGTVSLTTEVTGILPVANGGTNASSVGSAGSVAYSTGSAYAFSAVGALGECLISGNTGAPTWSSCSTAVAGSIPWQVTNGTANLKNSTLDMLVGGNSTTSAKFAFLNVNSGTPTASISAGTTGGLYFTASGSAQTTAYQNLNIGGGTTGNIIFNNRNNTPLLAIDTVNNRIGVGTTAPNEKLEILNGNFRLRRSDSTAARISAYWDSLTAYGFNLDSNLASTTSYANGYGIYLGTVYSSPVTSGTYDQVRIADNFNPASGNGVANMLRIAPTINQTGGASGVSRGLYINPTLTAAADWRSVELSNNSGYGIYQSGASASNYFNGNVGVGTASPTSKLDVIGSTADQITFLAREATGTASSNPYFSVQQSGGLVDLYVRGDGKIMIGGNEGVGIGTTVPANNSLVVSKTSTFNDDVTISAGRFHLTHSSENPRILMDGDGNASWNTNYAIQIQNHADVDSILLRNDGLAYFAGNVGIGDTTPAAMFTVGSGDLFQVNSSGAIAAATGITSSGTITLSAFSANGGLLYTNGSGVVAQTAVGSNGECLVSAGGGAPGWSSCSAAVSSSIAWEVQNGAANLKNTSLDLLVGGTSSTSAKFAVLNVNSGTPTASISAGTSGGLYFTASGSAQTTARQNLNIGGGTTGNIIINNRNNTPLAIFDTVNDRLGIGKVPTSAIDVNGAIKGQQLIADNNAGGWGGTVNYYAGGIQQGYVQADATSNGNIVHFSANGYRFYTDMGGASYAQTFSIGETGNVNMAGSLTIGDASADTVTANAAAWTFANDTTVALSGGVNGLNFDSNTLSIDATNNRVGIGTAAPSATLDVTGNIRVTGSSQIYAENNENLTVGTTGTNGNLTLTTRDSMIFTFGAMDGDESFVIRNSSAQNLFLLDPNAEDLELGRPLVGGSSFTVFGADGVTNFHGTNLSLRAGNAGGGAGNLNGGDLFLYGGENNLSGADGDVILAHNGTTALGNVGIGDNSPSALLTVGSGDLFQVNSSGAIAAATGITSSGTITLSTFTNNGGLLYTNGSGVVAQTAVGSNGECLVSAGGGAPGWSSCSAAVSSSIAWEVQNGAANLKNTSLDLLVGGNSTASADFAVLNVNGTGPATASVSGNLTVMPNTGVGGNVGIATSTPIGRLDVRGQGTAYADKVFRVTDSAGTSLLTTTGDGRTYLGADSGLNGNLVVTNPSGSSKNLAIFKDNNSTGTPELNLLGSANAITYALTGSSGKLFFGNMGIQSQQMALDTSTGNLGIGTASPNSAARLHILGGGLLMDSTGGTDNVQFELKHGSTALRLQNYSGASYLGASGAFILRSGTTGGLGSSIGGVEALRIASTGGVTINEDGGDQDFRVEGDTDANLLFVDASTDRVGIGTATPSQKFTVDANGAQIRLRRADATRYRADFQIGSNGLNINAYDDTGATYLPLRLDASTLAVYSAGTTLGLYQSSAGSVSIGGDLTPDSLFSVGSTSQFQVNSSGTIAAATGITSSGTITLSAFTSNGGLLYTNGSGVVAQTAVGSNGECLVSAGGGAPGWSSCSAAVSSSIAWEVQNGAANLKNSTLDLLVGGNSSASAKFAVLNVNNGTPTASVSAGTAGAAYFTASGSAQTTARQDMNIGGGTTGNIVFNNRNNTPVAFIDSVNNRLGLGTTAPNTQLHIAGGGNIYQRIQSTTSGSEAGIIYQNGNSVSFNLGKVGSGLGGSDTFRLSSANNSRIMEFSHDGTGYFSSNIGIGTTSPVAPLHVSAGYGGNPAVIINQLNSGAVLTASASGTTRFTVNNNATPVTFTNTGIWTIGGGLSFSGAAPSANTLSFGQAGTINRTSTGSGVGLNALTFSGSENNTSGSTNFNYFFNSFAPTSGTGIFNQIGLAATINQTGGANGITRGLYVNPTLTAAADWRSIETSNNSGYAFYGAGTANSYFGGNLGIGDTSPAAALTVGSGDLFQVNSSGAIAAATGITSSGTITFSGLSDGLVRSTSGVLSGAGTVSLTTEVTGVLPVANGGTNASSIGSAGSIAYSTGSAYAFSAVGALGECLVSGNTGAPTWASCSTAVSGSIAWEVQNGAANLKNTSLDLLVGGNSTASADFAVLNVNGTGPATASVSGNLIVMPKTGLGGRLGIGTTNPGQALDVVGKILFGNAGDAGGVTLREFSGGSALEIRNISDNSYYPVLANAFSAEDGTVNTPGFNFGATSGDFNTGIRRIGADNISLVTGAVDRLSITAAGLVGIGTTTPSSMLDVTTNALGVTQTSSSGLALVNTTAAAAGAQQISPAVRWTAQGWKTNATAASQPVEFRSYVLPVQGTTNPTGQWLLQSSINSAAYGSLLTVNSNAGTTEFLSTGVRFNNPGGNIGGISLNGSTPITNTFMVSNGFTLSSTPTPSATGTNILSFSSSPSLATSGTTNLTRMAIDFTPTSGTALFTGTLITPTINQTGGANGITRGLYVNPTLTAAADWRSIETSNNSGYSFYGAGTANSYFGGNVGIGDTTPSQLLSVGNGDLFTVNTAGNVVTSGTITAATDETINGVDINAGAISDITNLTASGTITFSGLSDGLVRSTSGVLSGAGTVSLTTEVTGVLPIANGGTNSTATPTNGGIAYGTGTAYAFTAAGSAGQCLVSNGAAAPSWTSCSSAASNFWQLNNTHNLSASNLSYNILLGNTASSSANIVLNADGSAVFNEQGLDRDFRVEGDTAANLLFVDASTDRVGIGTNTPSTTLSVIGDQYTSGRAGIGVTPTTLPNSTLGVLRSISGAESMANIDSIARKYRGTSTGETIVSGTFDASTYADTDNSTTGSQTAVSSILRFSATSPYSNNVTNAYNFLVNSPTLSGTGTRNITNQYGLYISSLTGATNNYAIYTAGTTPSYFGGNVGIGVTVPDSQFEVRGADASAVTAITRNTDASGIAVNQIRALAGHTLTRYINTANTFVTGVNGSTGYFQISDNTGFGANDRLTIDTSGNVGIGDTTPAALFTVGTSDAFQVNASGNVVTTGTITAAIDETINGVDINAGAISDVTNLTASGTITFSGLSNGLVRSTSGVLSGAGTVSLTTEVTGVLPIANGGTNSTATPTAGAIAYGTGTAYAFSAVGTTGECLQSNGAGAPTWGSCAAGSSNFWTIANGAIYPTNVSTDMLIGGTSSASAKFAFLNVTTGTPTASISAGTAGASYLTATGTLGTTAGQDLALAPSGTTRLTVTNGGNVGIGTTAPRAALDVDGHASASGALFFTGTDFLPRINLLNDQSLQFRTSRGGDAGLSTRMTLSNNGDLAVGSHTPEARLHVNGGSSRFTIASGNNQIELADTLGTYDWAISQLSDNLRIQDNNGGGTVLTIATATGNFGLGDTSPAAKFTVGNGDLFQVNSSGIIASIDGVAHTIDDVSGNLTLTSNSSTVSIADALSVTGAITATGTLTANTDETINGVDINAGTVSDVVNLTINAGGDLTIGTIGLNDVGSSNITSGASLVGVFDEFDNSASTTLQDVLDDLDAAITTAAAGGSFTLAGDSGTSQTISSGNTMSVVGGTNGIDTVASATDTLTLNLDTTEIGTTTFGAGSGFTWTFDAGATDPTIAFASNALTFTAGTNTFAGNVALGNNTLSGGTATIDFTNFDVTSAGALTAASTITGTTLNGTTGINTGAGAGTNRITNAGALVNITTITASGAITAATDETINGIDINAGAISDVTNLTASGTITFSGLSNGLVRSTSGVLSGAGIVSLTTEVTGVLPIANGGTNSTATPTNGGIAYGTGTAYAFTAAGTSGQCLQSNGAAAPTWGSCTGTMSDEWSIAAGALYANNTTTDFLIGGTSTASARFAMTNVNSGVPTFSLRDGLESLSFQVNNGGVDYIASSQSLQMYAGGNITLNANSGTADINLQGDVNLPNGAVLRINSQNVLSENTLGSSVTTSSLTSVGTLTGLTVSGTTTLSSLNTAGGVVVTNGSGVLSSVAGSSGQCLISNGTSAPTWGSCTAGATNYWQLNNTHNLSASNLSYNILLGDTATASANTVLNADGSAVFNEQGVGTSDFRIETDLLSHAFFVDASTDRIGFGTSTPAYQAQFHNSTGQADFAITTDVNVGSANTTQLSFISDLDGTPSYASIGQFGTGGLRLSGIGNIVAPDVMIATSGNVGIGGDTTPDALFSVGSTSQFQVDGSGNLTTAGTITASTAETINGVDINAGTISDVVNLAINAGGDLTINGIGLNDVGSSNITSGASLIGVYDELDNSASTTLQDVLDDLDAAISSAAAGAYTGWTLAGDSGSSQAIASGNTASIVGGTNGIDTVASATDTLTLNLDTTEIGTTTFGSGSAFTWTFDAGTTDPTMAFADGTINLAGGNLTLGGTSETLANTGFVMDGNDLFVAGMAGFEGNVYTDGSFIAGASTHYGNGTITQTTGETLTMGTTNANLTLQTTTAGDIILNPVGDVVVQSALRLNGTDINGASNETRITLDDSTDYTNLIGNVRITNGVGTVNFVEASGDLTITPSGGDLSVAGRMNVSSGNDYRINNTVVLNATTLGSGVTTSSLTTVGALSSGSIASGFGTIATANTITGTTLNGTTGINSGAGAGTQRIDASGNLVNIAAITASGNLTIDTNTLFANATTNSVGIGTTGPDRALEINHATGNNLRLTLNDSDGSAANYVDILVTAGGGLNIDPTNGVVAVDGGLNLTSSGSYSINGTNVLSATTLGSGVTASSLTSVGTLTALTVQGTVNINTSGSSVTTIANNGTLTMGSGNSTQTINLGTGSGAKTINIGTASTGTISLGGGSSPIAVNSTTWGITSAGVASGFTGLSVNGTVDINTSGSAVTNIGTSSSAGTVTIGGSGTQSIFIGGNASGAKSITIGNTVGSGFVNLVSGSAGIALNTATSGPVGIGGGTGTVYVNSSSWDISSAGVATGFTGITTSNTLTAGAVTISNDTGSLTVGRQNNTSEGGQINLTGAASYDGWTIDSYTNNLRFFTSSANTNTFEINNYSTGVANLSVEGGLTTGAGAVTLGLNSNQMTISGMVNSNRNNYLCINGSGLVNYNTSCSSSSARFKENVENLSYGLDEVMALRPVFFTYKADQMLGTDRKVGFIAEEVYEIIPEVTVFDSNGVVESLDYEKLVSLLVSAVQELNYDFVSYQDAMDSQITTAMLNTTGNLAASSGTFNTLNVNSLNINSTTGSATITNLAADTAKFGQVQVINTLGTETASITNTGAATFRSVAAQEMSSRFITAESMLITGDATVEGTLSAQSARFSALQASGATVSGTLYADNLVGNISADSVQGLEDRIAALVAAQTASMSATPEPDPETQGDIDTLANGSGMASGSGEIVELPGDLIVNGMLQAAGGLVTSTLIVDGTTITNSDFSFVTDAECTLETGCNIFAFQPSGVGTITFLNNLVVMTDGTVTINGDLTVTGAVAAAEVQTDRLVAQGQSLTVDLASASASTPEGDVLGSLIIRGNDGKEVAAYSADGSSRFLQLSLTAQAATADSANEDQSEQLESSSGTATLKAGKTEFKIRTSMAKADSLVYLTATSATGNKVLYMKAQADGEFTVAIDGAHDADITFNWWVVGR